VAVDFGSRRDLYVRFKHAAKPIGDATNDGLVIFFYEDGKNLVGLELLDAEPFI
jgi:hypothetical protein